MNTVTKSVKKARRRVKGTDSLKSQKKRVHRHNRRRMQQLLRARRFDDVATFDPKRLTAYDIS